MGNVLLKDCSVIDESQLGRNLLQPKENQAAGPPGCERCFNGLIGRVRYRRVRPVSDFR